MESKPWFAHYDKNVPHSVEIPEIGLHQLLANAAQKYPNQVAVRMVLKYLPLGLAIESKLTYQQLDELTDRFAAALQGLGVGKGDRVSLMLPNLPQQVIAYFGTIKAGAIVVNTNPTYTPRELQQQLQDSGAKVIVMLSGLYERLAQIRTQTSVEQVIIADVPDSLSWPFKNLAAKQVRASGMMKDIPAASDIHPFYGLLKSAPRKPKPVTINPDDVMLFQYSGGTTGTPKAAMLTHRNLVANAKQIVAWFTTAEEGKEKLLGALPFFHVYGMTVTMLFAVALCSEMILVPDPRNTNHILDVIQQEYTLLRRTGHVYRADQPSQGERVQSAFDQSLSQWWCGVAGGSRATVPRDHRRQSLRGLWHDRTLTGGGGQPDSRGQPCRFDWVAHLQH